MFCTAVVTTICMVSTWGALLNQRYMSTKTKTYRATTQLCMIKSSSLNEIALNKQQGDTSFLKFDGKLEVDNDAAAANQFQIE